MCMRVAAILIVASGLVCPHLTRAAELSFPPATAPSRSLAVDERLRAAAEQEQQARAALERARTERVKTFDQTSESRDLRTDIDARQQALQEARRTGSPQDKLDASSAYNAARQKLERRRNEYLMADETVAAADK